MRLPSKDHRDYQTHGRREGRASDVLPGMGWSDRPTAPGPWRPTLGVYAAVLVPGVLGAVFAWPWWLVFLLLAPAVVLSARVGWLGAELRGIHSRSRASRGFSGIGGLIRGPLGIVGANLLAERYWGLSVAGAAVAFDLAVRAWWHRRDHSAGPGAW